MLKYVHARLPGRELIHLIRPDRLERDPRFGVDDEYVVGLARTLCGELGTGWLVGTGRGESCRTCQAKR